jgi:hypothetical protein
VRHSDCLVEVKPPGCLGSGLKSAYVSGKKGVPLSAVPTVNGSGDPSELPNFASQLRDRRDAARGGGLTNVGTVERSSDARFARSYLIRSQLNPWR